MNSYCPVVVRSMSHYCLFSVNGPIICTIYTLSIWKGRTKKNSSEYSDQTPPYVASDLGIHCLDGSALGLHFLVTHPVMLRQINWY